MNNLQAQMIHHHGPIFGTFRLSETVFGEDRNGRPFVRFKLEDMSGCIYAYSFLEQIQQAATLNDFSRVYIEGQLRSRGEGQVVEVMTLFPIKPATGDIVRLIPQSLCPLSWLLPELAFAVSRISIAPLKQFIEAVLADDGIAFPFVSVPGSLKHHHSYPGGLLKHSLECFSIVEKQRDLPQQDYELALVASLFHDIGKILTLTHDMKLTSLGASIDHDKLTCEVLGTYLHQFAKSWPEGAKELRHNLGWKVRAPVPHYNTADLVAYSDRMSAGMDMRRRRK